MRRSPSIPPARAARSARRALAPLLVAVALATAGCSNQAADAPASSTTAAPTTTSGGGTAGTGTTVAGAPTTAGGPATPPTTSSGAGSSPTTTGQAGSPSTLDPLGRGGQVDPEGNPLPSTTAETFGPTTTGPTPPASSASYCGKVAEALTALNAAKLGVADGGGDHPIADVQQRYAALASSAPDAIRADMSVVSDKLAAISTAGQLSSVDGDPAVIAAREQIAAWVKPNCGFDPDNPTA